MKKILKVNANDDMIVALADLEAGETVNWDGEEYIIQEKIPAKHKFAVKDFEINSLLKMYGVVVGYATKLIKRGRLISTENLKHASADYHEKTQSYQWEAPQSVAKYANRTFNGYHRPDGKVGTANHWLFIPTVFCENRNLDVIREALHNALGYNISDKYKAKAQKLVDLFKSGLSIEEADLQLKEEELHTSRLFPNVDGIKFLNHQGGCGGTRQDSATLSVLLAAYADHPNVAGVTILSLGCQHLQVEHLKNDIYKRNPNFNKPLLCFEQQQSQSEEQLLSDAIKQTFLGLIEINKFTRQPAPLTKLTLGVKCGGSDGFSGISANPAVGYAADILVGLGGKVLLAEFPELNGVEQELVDRCVDSPSAEKFIRLMRSYSAQAKSVGSGFDMNPSPGNIKDGLITDAIKSAGAAKKGGTAPVSDVLDYTEPALKPGLSLVCTPGNDVEATTGKAAAGANLILFTTGLGTPTGNPICPVIKISTNTALAQRMADIIDLDTGGIIRGESSIEEMGERILDFCIAVASGEILAKSVKLGQDDFIPWKRGISL
ncbi:MAG TPA: altronate dehydratase family protein [Cytophagaceae bacterium]